MKKKVLLSSIATIVICLCLIAGSTFALFTDTTDFDISVTSGDIEIFASAEISAVYSAKKHEQGQASDEFLIDEFGNYYYHEEQSASYVTDNDGVITKGVFSNGGDVQFVDGKLTLSRITPGDRVDVTINIENSSDVAFVYRYKLISNNTNLATGMVVTIDGTPYESLAVWTSDWKAPILAPDGNGGTIDPKTISIELPVYAGNEYQTERAENKIESVEYTIIVEAVQANAITTNEEEFQIYQTEDVKDLPAIPDETGASNGTLSMLVENKYFYEGNNITLDNANAPISTVRNVTVEVDDVAINTTVSSYVMIYDCDFTDVEAGEFIMYGTSGYCQVMVSDNCTINGNRITQEDLNTYFGGNAIYYLIARNVETD